jgi:5-hydroxyisourate hydrolase-like protein (transthyretin family)
MSSPKCVITCNAIILHTNTPAANMNITLRCISPDYESLCFERRTNSDGIVYTWLPSNDSTEFHLPDLCDLVGRAVHPLHWQLGFQLCDHVNNLRMPQRTINVTFALEANSCAHVSLKLEEYGWSHSVAIWKPQTPSQQMVARPCSDSRRKSKPLKGENLHLLQESFVGEQYPAREILLQLANQAGTSLEHVQGWFARMRRMQRQRVQKMHQEV